MRAYINYNKVYVGWLLLLVVLLSVACSGDSEDPAASRDEATLQLVVYTKELSDPQVSPTRAIPAGYSQYPAADDENVNHIGVYMTTAEMADAPGMGTFFYANGKWNSLVSVKPEVEYFIYGFMPSDISTCTVAKVGSDFSKGARLTLEDIPPVSLKDLCIITAVQDMNSEDDDIDLTTGHFNYTGKAKDEKNQVSLMFVHAFAAVRMEMKVEEEYAKLRDIRLKEVRLRSGYIYAHKGKFTFTNNNRVSDWSEPSRQLTSEEREGVTLFSNETGEDLSSETAKVFEGYWIPVEVNKNNLYLHSRYDVYDKKGNLVRKNCYAENRLPPNKLSSSMGSRTKFNLIVRPTYLYVLSEPDLDNPTIEVRSE